MSTVVLDPLSQVYQFTYVHPTYHSFFKSCYDQIMEGTSAPLCSAYRHYIGLMAASRHRCLILMDYHAKMFEKFGGDTDWLSGVSRADYRFAVLDEMNRLLAHQPWMIKAELIYKLVGRGSPDARNTFTLSELTHAVCIMTQTHVLCTFLCAVGLERRDDLAPAEVDFLRCDDEDHIERRNNKENKQFEHPASVSESSGEVEKLVKRMLDLESNSRRARASGFQSFDGNDQAGGESPESISEEEDYAMPVYSYNPHFAYTDFQTRADKSVKTFKIHEFTWETHAYNSISDLVRPIADKLDKKFDHIQRLTYNFMGSYKGEVDTTKYREAVWNYIQFLYGIKYDDYDYAKVNVLLDKCTKSFIKNAACFPHKLTNEFVQVMNGFKTSEKIHVVIMVMEARHQSQMLHFTRALCNYNAQTLSRKGIRRPLD